MTPLPHVRTALIALRRNALRSVLTTLGIIIGVGAVLVMVAVGSGARQAVEARINSLGSNLLTATTGSRQAGGRLEGAGTATPFSERDLAAIRARVGVAEEVSGSLTTSNTPVIYGSANWPTSVTGVHVEFLTVRDWPLAEGRFFTDRELASGARVAVLGATLVRELFGGENPLGERIRVKNVPFEVIGVLETRGQSAGGRDQDDLILVPISAARARIAGRADEVPDQVGQMLIKVRDGENLTAVAEEIGTLLRERRRLRDNQPDNFTVRSWADFVRARTETQNTLSWLLGATAIISLIVGGIGIMNIMLVSVTERTREIGLRMALGARPGDILTQFLVEAVVLCLVGGLLGLAIGGLVILAIANLANWPILVSPATVLLALGAATAVGVGFGYFPARRAARLNPIEALRQE